jgi:hypothetical protein
MSLDPGCEISIANSIPEVSGHHTQRRSKADKATSRMAR